MGTPRESVRLVREGAGVRTVAPRSAKDWAEAMKAHSAQRVEKLAAAELSGYVLKEDSPSCGMERVKVYGDGMPTTSGRGLFAEALLACFPNLPVEEKGRLCDPHLRDNFVERVFAYHSSLLAIDKCQYKCYIAGVSDVSPSFLLDHPELVEPAAPWCVWLDNLQLGVLLLAQPWIGGGGLHRADMERQLGRLADADLLVGPVYFQRVNRAVAALESRGQLAGEGAGRRRGFVITPQGFAALILNLQVLRADPTVDGSEFELKRALVAMWNLVLERLLEWPEEIDLGPEMTQLFEGLDRLEVWGQEVITARVVADAFNILRLIGVQGEHVQKLRRAAELRIEQTNAQADMSRSAELPRLFQVAGLAKQERTAAAIVETVRGLAAGTMPQLEASAQIARYTAYLRYLESLAGLYSRELKVVDVGAFRSVLTGRAV